MIASNAAWNRSPFGASHFLGRVMPSWIVLDLKIEQCQRRDGNSLHAGAHEITSFCNNPVPYTLRLIMLKNTAHLIHIIRLCENYWTLAGSKWLEQVTRSLNAGVVISEKTANRARRRSCQGWYHFGGIFQRTLDGNSRPFGCASTSAALT